MRYILILFVFFLPNRFFGQEKCICCSYYSIDKIESFKDFFDLNVIRNNGIKYLEVMTIEKSGNDSTTYLQSKFQFDKNGNIYLKKQYYKGKASMQVDYVRDKKGIIIQTKENYIDSLENINMDFPSTIKDYTYDFNGRLIKIKERDYKGDTIPDNLAQFTKYKYDKADRLINEYFYIFYGDSMGHSITESQTNYDKNNNALRISKLDGKPSMRISATYNLNRRILTQIDYSLPDNKIVFEQYFTYNADNHISKYISKSNSSYTECPDGDNLEENYHYNKLKLLDLIIHKYGNVTCKMILKYKK